jgi:3-methyladenine DNA glycosylase Mpg
MARWDVLPRTFYARDPVTVAQALLGMQLVREEDGSVLMGIIVETEAYCRCHVVACKEHRPSRTRRTREAGGGDGQR